MEELMNQMHQIATELRHLSSDRKIIEQEISTLESKQNELVSSFVEQHGWSAIDVGGVTYLPYQNHDGSYGVRRL